VSQVLGKTKRSHDKGMVNHSMLSTNSYEILHTSFDLTQRNSLITQQASTHNFARGHVGIPLDSKLILVVTEVYRDSSLRLGGTKSSMCGFPKFKVLVLYYEYVNLNVHCVLLCVTVINIIGYQVFLKHK